MNIRMRDGSISRFEGARTGLNDLAKLVDFRRTPRDMFEDSCSCPLNHGSG